MHSFVLQDWITIRGTSGATILQGEAGYLDLAPYQDAFFYLDVREFTGSTPQIGFETAPFKEEVLFKDMIAPFNVLLSPANPYRVFITTGSTPVARYVRWKLIGAGVTPWDVTFRVLVATNALGL